MWHFDIMLQFKYLSDIGDDWLETCAEIQPRNKHAVKFPPCSYMVHLIKTRIPGNFKAIYTWYINNYENLLSPIWIRPEQKAGIL